MKHQATEVEDGLGGKLYRVTWEFQSPEVAAASIAAVNAVVEQATIVVEVTPPAPAPVVQPPELVLDEDEAFPGCPSGLCGMD